jgi:hypothetical protein
MQVGDASPAMEVVAFMLGAGLASAAHVTKAGTRLIVNASPEPFSNVLLSLGEDAGAVWLSYMSLAHPRIAFFVTLGCMLVVILLLPIIFRSIRMLLSGLLFKIRSFMGGGASADHILPYAFDSFLEQHRMVDEELLHVTRGFAARAPKVPRFSPVYVAVTSGSVYLLYKRWFRLQAGGIPLTQLRRSKNFPGMLFTKWVLRTNDGDWIFYMHEPVSVSLTQLVPAKVKTHEI